MPRSRPWSASRSSWGSSLPAGPAALSMGGASCRGVPLVQVRRQLRGGSSVRRDRPGRAYPLRLRLRHAALSVGRVLRECSFCRAYLAGARLWRRRIVGCGRVQSSPDAPCRRAPSAGRSKVRWTHPARAFVRRTCPSPCVRAHVRIPGLVWPRALGSRQVPQALRTSQARPPPRTRPINADFASWETNLALIGRSLARRASSATSPAGRGTP